MTSDLTDEQDLSLISCGWMEIWMVCRDKLAHWGQQAVYWEMSSANKHHYPHQRLTCCFWCGAARYAWYWAGWTASHLHALCEFALIDPAAVDFYLFVNTFNWVYSQCGSMRACTEFLFYKEQDLSMNKKKHVKAFEIAQNMKVFIFLWVNPSRMCQVL